jgi:ABC-type Zn uptake system ZnuABC Zn-binding protein ZnuA
MRALSLFLALGLVVGGQGGTLVATTPIVADILSRICGERFQVVSLIPFGVDPHAFELTSQDVQILLSAEAVFTNGAGLEAHLAPLLGIPEVAGKIFDLSKDLPLRFIGEEPDPHVWLDPLLVAAWAEKIAEILSQLDPTGGDFYASQAQELKEDLFSLDRWIQAEIEKIPPERRLLVTDHYFLGYFAARYGFTEVGAIVPSETTLSEPSAKELVALVEKMKRLKIPAIFVGPNFNMSLAQSIARESGAQVVVLHAGNLSGPGGPAPDYFSLMRELVRSIVEALK